MAQALDITLLQRYAIQYKVDLEMLPYAVLEAVLGELGINFLPGIQDKDTIVSFQRLGGLTKPYTPGQSLDRTSVGKAVESVLKVETGYVNVFDNIKNYKEKIIIRAGESIGINQSKRHPFEVQQMMMMVRTVAEDILDAIFAGQRNTADKTPLGCFDGFDKNIDDAILAGTCVAQTSGSLAAPANSSDTTAFDNLIAWVRKSNYHLRKAGNLLLPFPVYQNVMDAANNKLKFAEATPEILSARINALVAGNIIVKPSIYMGTGDRIILTGPDNMDFGCNTQGDFSFVQIRDKSEDPNEIQYWMQFDAGTRIRSFHEKKFMVNEGTPVAAELSGDYRS